MSKTKEKVKPHVRIDVPWKIDHEGVVTHRGKRIGHMQQYGMDANWFYEPAQKPSEGWFANGYEHLGAINVELFTVILNWIKQKTFNERLFNAHCPDCNTKTLLCGPGGIGAQNVKCETCSNEFNIIGIPMQCHRIHWSGSETRW